MHLTKPKHLGGWGLKDLDTFGIALKAKNIWRCLFTSSLWNRVILAKYLQGWAVGDWLRLTSYNVERTSVVWRALLKSIPLLKSWLAWKPGDGWNIRVGRDSIVGLDKGWRLSDALLTRLMNRNIFFLAQAAKRNVANSWTVWYSLVELGFMDALGIEWDNYINLLRNVGICLNSAKDCLFWSKKS